jgi:hypothetical protein
VAQLLEDVSVVGSLLPLVEEGSVFYLRGRSHDIFNCPAFHVYRTIGSWVVSWFIAVAQVEYTPTLDLAIGSLR